VINNLAAGKNTGFSSLIVFSPFEKKREKQLLNKLHAF